MGNYTLQIDTSEGTETKARSAESLANILFQKAKAAKGFLLHSGYTQYVEIYCEKVVFCICMIKHCFSDHKTSFNCFPWKIHAIT